MSTYQRTLVGECTPQTPQLVAIGEFLWDEFASTRRPGGGTTNLAFHAASTGISACALTAIGDDENGKALLQCAKEAGIDVRAQVSPYPTSRVSVHMVEGEPHYTIHENVAWDHLHADTQAVELVQAAELICVGTLASRSEESRKAINDLLCAAREKETKVFLDVNIRAQYYSRELVNHLAQLASLMKVNELELPLIASMYDLHEETSIEHAPEYTQEEACALAQRVAQAADLDYLVLTAGARWSAIVSPSGILSLLPTPRVSVVDTVGAGDSFSGTFLGYLLQGAPINEAHEKAVQRAAYVCQHQGGWAKPE